MMDKNLDLIFKFNRWSQRLVKKHKNRKKSRPDGALWTFDG